MKVSGREALKYLQEREGITNAEYARRLNITPAALWDRLNNKKVKDIPCSLLSEMCEVLGCKVMVVSASSEVVGIEIK